MRSMDPYSVEFWWVVIAAILILLPLNLAAPRRWALAAINLGFLALMMKSEVVVVVAIAAVALAVLRASAGRGGALALAVGGVATLLLFLSHKRPDLGAALGLGEINPILGGVGFSYAALRLVEVGRAVYERRHPPPDLLTLFNYLFPFHMLAAGPIQSYDDFAAQPGVPPPLTTAEALAATERIARGVFKKYVLAQGIERLFLTGFHAHGGYMALELQLNYIWLFLDFSAYSDIAVGIGRLMGVATPENFNRPYLARNASRYWETWHISLSQFILRNVFIPMQVAILRRTDGRAPILVASLVFATAFLLCGLWHQVGATGLAWGAWQAMGLITWNVYRHALQRRLGRKGVNAYMANPYIRVLAILLTFEFEAVSVAILVYPFHEVSWPILYHR